MAQAVGTFSSYDAQGNREDLIDNIFDVSPVDTPVLSAIAKKKASNRIHEWQTDQLAAAAVNAHVEGDDANPGVTNPTVRLNNHTQIMKKHVVVSGTQEEIESAGRSSEVGYQAARRMEEMKLDAELSILDGGAAVGNAKVTGNDTTPREMASINTYLTSNVSLGVGGGVATGDGTNVMTAGADRDFTSAILDAVATTAYTNGANPKMLVVSPTNKAAVGDFAVGSATRYVSSDDKKLTSSIDVYTGDFHDFKVVPCRQLIGDNVYGIDPEYLAWCDLRPMRMMDLAKTGDSIRKEITWEGCVQVSNEAAHLMVADTNG